MSPTVVVAKLAAMAQDDRIDIQDALIHLGKSVPAFSQRVLEDMGEEL